MNDDELKALATELITEASQRDEMEDILGDLLRVLALDERARLGLTQAKMAETLAMSQRSYAYIENGQSNCSALTTILLLLQCPTRENFFSELERRFRPFLRREKLVLAM